MDDLEFRLLGPIEAVANGAALDLGGPRQRAVLALLLLDANRVVSADRLIEDVWGTGRPASAASTLQSYVSRLRRLVGPDVIASRSSGYELRAEQDSVDALRFAALAAAGRELLASGDARAATAALQEALALWRGEPFGDLAYESWALPEAERLSELRLAAVEDRVDADLALGRHADLVGELELLVVRHPLRERFRGQLMLALYRAGRQAEALEAYQEARRALVDGLGLEPARTLQELEQAILRQDTALDVVGPEHADAASTLVGRAEELARLRAAFDAAVAGSGSLVVVTGEPGIGKTRLAEQLALDATRAGAAVVWGRCWEAGGAPPYWPWTQLLSAYLAGVDPEELRRRFGPRLPRMAAGLPSLRALYPELGTDLAPPEDRFAVFSAGAELLGAEARRRPIVAFLDDLHAADEPSLLLLRFLAGELSSWPLLVVALWRDGEGSPAVQELLSDAAAHAHVRLALGGLAPEAVSALVEDTTGVRSSDDLVESIHADTGGNPLFVAEVARMLAAERTVDGAPGRLRLPAGVRDAIATRLRSLSPDCRDALTHASVLGREFDLPTLARVAGVEPATMLDSLDEAIAARVLADVPDGLGRFGFAHALMRESIYNELTAATRMRLHRHVGTVLEDVYAGSVEPHLSELAHHFFEAAPAGEAEKAAGYAERAARRALEALAFEEAARLFRLALRALELAGRADPARLTTAMLGLGESQARAGDVQGARTTFLRAADLARDTTFAPSLATAALGVGGRFVWGRQNGAELVPLLEEALAALGAAEPALRARLLARLAGALRHQPTREPRASISEQAVAIARELGDPAVLSYTLEARWSAIWWVENPAERLAVADELVALASGSSDRERVFEAHFLRGASLHELGRIREADGELRLAGRAALELGQPAQQWAATLHFAGRAQSDGRLEEAEVLAGRAYAEGVGSVGADAIVAHQIQLFVLRREQARLAEIEESLTGAAAEFRTRPLLRHLLAHLYAALGRDAEARGALDELGREGFADLPRDNEWLFALSFLPEVCEAAGDSDQAERLYGLLAPFADRNACDLDEADSGSVHRPLGLLAAQLGRQADALAHLEAAVAHNDALGFRPWAAWSRFELSRVLQRAGDERWRRLRDDAAATAQELGMAALLARARG